MINIHKHTYAVITTVLIAVVAFMASCTTQQNAAKKADAARTERQIADSIEAKTMQFTFDYVTPMRFPPHYLTTNYSVRLQGDSLESYLPYFGRACRSNLANNDRSPLSFNGKADDIVIKRGKKNDFAVSFRTSNDTEQLEYALRIFPNGKVTLNVNSSDRETISFEGQMDINTKEDEK